MGNGGLAAQAVLVLIKFSYYPKCQKNRAKNIRSGIYQEMVYPVETKALISQGP